MFTQDQIRDNVKELFEELKELEHKRKNILFKIQLFQSICTHPETESNESGTQCLICKETW